MTGIVILNYNNILDTINCIESVERYNTSPIKYIVVDNGSSKKGVVEELHDYFLKKFSKCYCRYDYEKGEKPPKLSYLSYVVSKTNDGYARGNNKGLEYAYVDDEIDNILIINNDVLFVQDIIPHMSQVLETIEDGAFLSPLLLKRDRVSIDYNCARLTPSVWQILLPFLFMYKDLFGLISKNKRGNQILRKPDIKLDNNIIPIELPSGSCMMIKKSLMQSIGGFDPHTFLYFEENILFKKLFHKGKKSYLIPSLRCIHLGASTVSNNVSEQTQYASMNSSRYYLENYCKLTRFQRLIMHLSYFNMRIKIRLKNLM